MCVFPVNFDVTIYEFELPKNASNKILTGNLLHQGYLYRKIGNFFFQNAIPDTIN